ncbi:FecR domain-containing protein [Pollutimonas sp. M17]|uniref:FecR family protein n=1 Tax=Pollutimonas sp. M17 TaxID=2962065 RepID=UPI0021F40BE5|nr:FecR domain-containing protein [Pollutimonas sp. M17]UYO93709.1 FecR domain-containing protein [Pollutimonas sp. M17]
MSAFLFPPRLLSRLALAVSSLLPLAAMAQPHGAHGDLFLYRVVAGDTLIALSERFTDKADNWAVLQSLNAVQEPTLLPVGLELKIPFSLIPELPSQARVDHLAGPAFADDRPVKAGDQLSEGQTVATGENGFLTLMLADGSTLSVPAASSLSIERLRVFKGTGLTDTVFTLRQGSLESMVAPADTGVGRFEIRTPVSITGVRGTRLRVHAQAAGAQSEVLEGSARLDASQGRNATLRQGQGAAIDSSGQLLGVRALLPAPELGPASRGGAGWVIAFPPVPGASAYLLRVAADPQGKQLFSSQRFTEPRVTFSAPGAGTYYAVLRAVDSDGIMGRDASQSFEGRSLLRTSDGKPALSGFGHFVFLTEH